MEEKTTDNRNTFAIKTFLKDYLDLRKDKDNELETVDSIRKGVEFKGANLWILIFAIFMASLGLNVNSTAVIIGAMLISPLMGPIMGVGLSVGLNDFELMKRSLKSFLITTLFSVTTATIFFLVSPVAEGQSELLARTSPTIYDVFIALMGGLAGVTALSTKEKGNVIPGVAIATALMPPLCTAGYGLATGNLIYFLGAFYLYFINSVFISLATFLGVRVMHFQRKEFVDKNREKKVRKYIVLIAILTMCPAVYLTVGIVQDTFFESAANRFVNEQLSFENTQVLDKKIHHEGKGHEIRVVLIGQEVPEASIAIARSKMKDYKLDNTKLIGDRRKRFLLRSPLKRRKLHTGTGMRSIHPLMDKSCHGRSGKSHAAPADRYSQVFYIHSLPHSGSRPSEVQSARLLARSYLVGPDLLRYPRLTQLWV